MSSSIVYCVSCSNRLKPANAYKIFVDKIMELLWNTPQHIEYKGGGTISVCSEKCYQAFMKNMKEFWDPYGEDFPKPFDIVQCLS